MWLKIYFKILSFFKAFVGKSSKQPDLNSSSGKIYNPGKDALADIKTLVDLEACRICIQIIYLDGSNAVTTLHLGGPAADKLYKELGHAIPVIAQEIINREFKTESSREENQPEAGEKGSN